MLIRCLTSLLHLSNSPSVLYIIFLVESPSLGAQQSLTGWPTVSVAQCLSCRHLIDACSLRIQTNCLIGAYSWQAPGRAPTAGWAQSKKCRLHKRREVDKCLGRTLILFSHIVQHAQSGTLVTSAIPLYRCTLQLHVCVCVDVSMTCTCVSTSAAPPAHCHSLQIPDWIPRRVKIFV